MAVKGADGDKFLGIVITRPVSGSNSLADLKGKLVMIVGETLAAGYLSQRLSLSEQGIDISEMSVEMAADNRQENVIVSVSVGDVDAGFIRESAFNKAGKYMAPGSVKTIVQTAWLPNWAVTIDRELEPALRDRIRQAVLDLQEGGTELKALGLKGFRAVGDGEYDVMRELLSRQ